MRKTSQLLLLTVALFLWGGLPAHELPTAWAAEVVRDTALGARIADHIVAGDVHAFRVPLLAGTALRARLSVTSRDKSGGGGGGAVEPQLVVLDPAGATLGSVPADANDVQVTVGGDGTCRVEVQAGAFAGGYELRIEGQAPSIRPVHSGAGVVLSGAPTPVHIDAPAGSSVEIEVRRRSGARPRIDSVTDVLGRALTVFVKSARADRVVLEPVPVALDGGIDVTISADASGTGTYQLKTCVRAGSDRPSGGDEHESRTVVALLAPGADASAVAASLGFTLVETRGNLAVFQTPQGREGFEDDDAAQTETAAGVLSAETQAFAFLPEGSQANAPIVASDLGRSDVDQQAALARLHAAIAQRRVTGAGVVVAVLDGGVDAAHPYLAGRVLAGWDFVDGDADASEARNGLDDDLDGLVDEGYGHGTFVASLVLAAAPGASILPVRVLDSDGRGRVSDIAAGVTWAVEHGANVLNLSFGTLGGSPAMAAAVRYALGRGVSVVASTGNDGSRTLVDFPAALAQTLPGVVAVTALDAAGARAAFANSGVSTTIAAPGVDLVGAFPDGRYARWSGTSFSAALVSAGAALVLERRLGAPPSRVASLLHGRTTPFRAVVAPADRRLLGGGVLDFAKLVR